MCMCMCVCVRCVYTTAVNEEVSGVAGGGAGQAQGLKVPHHVSSCAYMGVERERRERERERERERGRERIERIVDSS
jgi:hypothetical protein